MIQFFAIYFFIVRLVARTRQSILLANYSQRKKKLKKSCACGNEKSHGGEQKQDYWNPKVGGSSQRMVNGTTSN
jgi:hypothetical protein